MASATGPYVITSTPSPERGLTVLNRSDARFETTAAWQAAEASNVELQNEVERNAQQAHQVAGQAANTAQVRRPNHLSV